MFAIYMGSMIPVGKSSIIHMALVCQNAYFSIFQFGQIPLTMSGFGSLSNSNGFNSLNEQN